MYFDQRRYAEGLPLFERTWQALRKLLGDASPRALSAEGNLANTLSKLGRYAEAEQLYRNTIEGQERVLGPNHPSTRRRIAQIAAMYTAWGKPDKAAEWLAKLPKEPPAKP